MSRSLRTTLLFVAVAFGVVTQTAAASTTDPAQPTLRWTFVPAMAADAGCPGAPSGFIGQSTTSIGPAGIGHVGYVWCEGNPIRQCWVEPLTGTPCSPQDYEDNPVLPQSAVMSPNGQAWYLDINTADELVWTNGARTGTIPAAVASIYPHDDGSADVFYFDSGASQWMWGMIGKDQLSGAPENSVVLNPQTEYQACASPTHTDVFTVSGGTVYLASAPNATPQPLVDESSNDPNTYFLGVSCQTLIDGVALAVSWEDLPSQQSYVAFFKLDDAGTLTRLSQINIGSEGLVGFYAFDHARLDPTATSTGGTWYAVLEAPINSSDPTAPRPLTFRASPDGGEAWTPTRGFADQPSVGSFTELGDETLAWWDGTNLWSYPAVANAYITAQASTSQATTGEPVTFTASVETAGDLSIPADPVFHWTFSDGSTAVGQTVTHSFSTPGAHNAVATVLDSEGNPAASSSPAAVLVTAPTPTPTTPMTTTNLSGGPYMLSSTTLGSTPIELGVFGSASTSVTAITTDADAAPFTSPDPTRLFTVPDPLAPATRYELDLPSNRWQSANGFSQTAFPAAAALRINPNLNVTFADTISLDIGDATASYTTGFPMTAPGTGSAATTGTFSLKLQVDWRDLRDYLVEQGILMAANKYIPGFCFLVNGPEDCIKDWVNGPDIEVLKGALPIDDINNQQIGSIVEKLVEKIAEKGIDWVEEQINEQIKHLRSDISSQQVPAASADVARAHVTYRQVSGVTMHAMMASAASAAAASETTAANHRIATFRVGSLAGLRTTRGSISRATYQAVVRVPMAVRAGRLLIVLRHGRLTLLAGRLAGARTATAVLLGASGARWWAPVKVIDGLAAATVQIPAHAGKHLVVAVVDASPITHHYVRVAAAVVG